MKKIVVKTFVKINLKILGLTFLYKGFQGFDAGLNHLLFLFLTSNHIGTVSRKSVLLGPTRK